MTHETIYRMKHLCMVSEVPFGVRFDICGTTYPNRNYVINRPQSKTSCLEYVVRGTGHLCVDGRELTARAGDTYFLPQGHDQYYYADRDDPWEKIWVNFSGEQAVALAQLYGIDGTFLYPGLDTSDLLLKFQYYATHGEPDAVAGKCDSLLTEVFHRLSRFLHAPETEERSPVQKMLLYIEQHATEPMSLEKLAEISGRSPSQAERLFRAETGVSVYRYTLEKKIEIACQLLRETAMSVREIASYLSFEDEYYFSGLFHRKTGFSPTAYRNRDR